MFWQSYSVRIISGAIIATCVTLWATMNYSKRIKDKTLRRYLQENFVLSVTNWRAGRWWTMFTCSIMHVSPIHLGINMYILWSLAPQAISLFGIPGFTTLWLASSLAGSALTIYWQERALAPTEQSWDTERSWDAEQSWDAGAKKRQTSSDEDARLNRGAAGASSAMLGIMAAFAAFNPHLSFQVVFIPFGFPAWAGVGVFTAWSAYCMYDPMLLPGVGHAAHVGGTVGGLVTYFAWLKPWLRRIGRI